MANAVSRPISPHSTTTSNSPVRLAEVKSETRCEDKDPSDSGEVSRAVIGAIEDITAEGQIDIDDEEEVEPAKMSPDPGQPTPDEVEAHRTGGHQPYRSWCKFCVMGRGLGEQHRGRPGSKIPRIGIDYFYITDREIKMRFRRTESQASL